MQKHTRSVSYQIVIGVDISKSWIDVCLLVAEQRIFSKRFANDQQGFSELFDRLEEQLDSPKHHWLVCLEDTGLYGRRLLRFLLEKGIDTWCESGLRIKRTRGIVRGKSDKIDAYRIARYAQEKQTDCQLVKPETLLLEKIKDLLSNRKRILRAIKALEVPIKELQGIEAQHAQPLQQANQKAIKGLRQSLKEIEKLIDQTLEENSSLKHTYELVTSVKSVGKILGLQLLIDTHGFTRMCNARKLACHAGVAPFSYQSGASVKGKNKTSRYANMKLKCLLHLAALNAIRTSPEIRRYYQRKVLQGKNKMSVINAVRNKIIQRVVAVVKRDKPYIEFPENYLTLS